jgi:hypothetical protein
MYIPCFDDDKRETRAEISTLQFFSMPCNGAAERAKIEQVSSTTRTNQKGKKKIIQYILVKAENLQCFLLHIVCREDSWNT